ncbi:MAG: 5-(carboxyamino)imidazole ribonucleotide synthase [Alphaproteobacteria bacterium]|nr:5-(carboxyamino)imidazole ribonucleotide synthase [Alphaproteobacteria bacterium]
MIRPGGTIGIIGGGQLGRMTALAAARLGYRCHVFTPEADSPAARVSAAATVAAYDDPDALARFARAVDVVTFEFENIPHESVRLLVGMVPVRPCWRVLAIAQDRLLEKEFFNALGIATAPWRRVDGPDSLARAVEDLGTPAILKTTRLGYDGKGQIKVEAGADVGGLWRKFGAPEAVLEGFVDFEREISVIVARGTDGAWAAWDPVENHHERHILATTTAPAPIPAALAAQAIEIAHAAAEALDVVGLLAVEMFVTRDGRLLVNEMAPRPHNSGHWTIDACLTDQFEQLVRAVCELPLGSPARHSDAVMENLIGDEVERWPEILNEPEARLHLYGKDEARPGRKMGHVTRLRPRGA